MNNIALNFFTSLNINVLYLIYVTILLIIIFKIKPKIYSFSFLFILYTFFTYFCGSLIYENNPELDYYHRYIDKNFTTNYSTKSFFVFIIGLSTFFISYFIVIKINFLKLKKSFNKNNDTKSNFIILVFLFLILDFFSLWMRFYFNVGVPEGEPRNKIAEYSWYFFDYSALILLVRIIYLSITSDKIQTILLGSILPHIYGLSTLFLGWRSGYIWVTIILFHVFLIYFFRLKSISQIYLKVFSYIVVPFVVLPFFFFFALVFRGEQNFESRINKFNSSSLSNSLTSTLNSDIFLKIYQRVIGIGTLNVTIANTKSNENNNVSFIKNVFTRNSLQPERYFGCNLIKNKSACPPIRTTYAPNAWSVFYIYNQIWGVIFGFFILGIFVSILDKFFGYYNDFKNSIPIYTIISGILLPAIVFEGTVVFYIKRHVLSFFAASIFIYFLIYSLNYIQNIKNDKYFS